MISKRINKAGWLAGLFLAGLTASAQAAPVTYNISLISATMGYLDATDTPASATHEVAPFAGLELQNDYADPSVLGGMVSTMDFGSLFASYVTPSENGGAHQTSSFNYTLDNSAGTLDFRNVTLDLFVTLLFTSQQTDYVASAYTYGDWTLLLSDFLHGDPASVFSTTFTFSDAALSEDSMYLDSSLGPGVYVTATFGGGLTPFAQSLANNTAFFTSLSVTDVPEPGSLALLGLGLAALVVVVRRRGSPDQVALAA